MWELHSPCNEPARCGLVHRPSHLFPYLVMVRIGDTEVVREQLATEADALEEVSYRF